MTQKPRRISEFLPEVLQTDLLQKFFAATGDQLFQPSNVEYLSAFVGEKPPYYKPTSEQYVAEINKNRRDYQLSPTAVSRDIISNEVTHTLFYDDLINKLRFQGGLVDDHNRLFENEYYSWGAPLNWDKFVNYSNYVWLPQGPTTIELLSPTNAQVDVISNISYAYVGNYSYPDPQDPELLVIKSATVNNPLVFVNGMKIKFLVDADVQSRSISWIVEGVGTSIRLVSDNILTYLAWENPVDYDTTPWDSNSLQDSPTYVVMGRGSANANPWSLQNRWFHKRVLELTQTALPDSVSSSAQRPILEFDYDLKLFNFGTRHRGFITLLDTQSQFLDQINGQWVTTIDNSNGNRTYLQIDQLTLDDDQIILFTNLRNPERNNKLYRVTNVRNSSSISGAQTKLGQVVLELLPNQIDPLGDPQPGDAVTIMQGGTWQNTCWWYNPVTRSWQQAQNRTLPTNVDPTSSAYKSALNSSPLFDLFNTRQEYLANPAVYPANNFAGCTIFEYARSSQGVIDPVLGFIPVVENAGARNFVFNNTLCSQQWIYKNNNALETVPGLKFYQHQSDHNVSYGNNWFVSSQPSRQYVVNEFVSKLDQQTFVIDQAPALQESAHDPQLLTNAVGGAMPITVSVGTKTLVLNQDYTVQGNAVFLFEPLLADQFVRIRSFAVPNNQATNGYFEIPSNLAANPNNQAILNISFGNLLPHLQTIIDNQQNLSVFADVSVTTNYDNLAQDQSLGTVIIQSRAPMLKLMGMNAIEQTTVFDTTSSVLDPITAIQWAQAEYLRFYNKFVNTLMYLYNNQGNLKDQTAGGWLDQALAIINVGKTRSSSWANSGFDIQAGSYCSQKSQTPTWIPASATRLGLTPAWEPLVFFDTSQPNMPLSMRTHNGALVVLKDYNNENLGTILNNQQQTNIPDALSNPVAQAWLLFEKLLYDNLPASYKNKERQLPVDPRTIFSGKYRQTNYSRTDQLKIQSAQWQSWLTLNQVEAFKNTTFDVTDPFTWNYSSCVDKQQQPVPGHWRGIYFWFFDTDQPHLAPWEMLGFSQQPMWWTQEYGAAPYTSGNLRMWRDLEQGIILHGPRAGVHTVWARPGLLDNIPVDTSGNLLPPFLAGVVTSLPTTVLASADWKFGDRSPLENVWLTQVTCDTLWAQWTYLAKPAQFMEYNWDGTRQEQILAQQPGSQWIYTDILDRKSSSEFLVHRENPQDVVSLPNPLDLDYYGSCGIQHWISEYLINDSKDVTVYFGNIIRGMNVNLAYRLGGFTDSQSTRIFVESFGINNNNSLLIPQEDVSTELLRSASTGEYVYTGVIVEFQGIGVGWRVIGYDQLNPFFKIVASDTKGPKNTVVIDNQRVFEYSRGLAHTQLVRYGTVFATRQEVYDFLISLGRAQQMDGWLFDQYDDVAGRPRNWSLSAREFLFWSQGPWASGTYIALSPLATLAKFEKDYGVIQNVGGLVNGAYSIQDRSGVAIQLQDVDFLRIDNKISVRPLNSQGIFGLRLYTTTLEHALIVANRTIFNDLMYDPVLNQRQYRVKFYGYRTLDWNGRMNAPGYLVTQSLQQINNTVNVINRIIPNFEKSVEDLRKLFEIDLATPYQLADNNQTLTSTITQSLPINLSVMAKNVVGYTPRSYLTQLLTDQNIAFQFYQGMIKQKGTRPSIDKLLRNNQILASDQNFEYYEEWAFRSAVYGNNLDNSSISILLDNTLVNSNPQLFMISGPGTSDLPNDDVYTILTNGNNVVQKSNKLGNFKLRNYYGSNSNDLPTAGYVLLDETTYTVVSDQDLQNLYSETTSKWINNQISRNIQAGDTVWQLINSQTTWNVYKICQPTWSISATTPSDIDISITQVSTTSAHNLVSGDRVILYGVINAGTVIDNTFVVNVIDQLTFEIQLTTSNIGSGGTALVYQSIRFANTQQRDDALIAGGWQTKDLAYVDGTSLDPWKVYSYTGTNWRVLREENYKVDPEYVEASFLYDIVTGVTQTQCVLLDPVKNKLPGIFDQQIGFRTPYDPAQYTHDPSQTVGTNALDAWGNDQVGMVWWDLSKLRFVDYEIHTASYRRQNWGKVAPGTSVDIYEWTRSTVPPQDWQDLVKSGKDLSAIGTTQMPSGQAKDPQGAYVLAQQLNSLNQLQDVFYFWVKNTTTVPDVSWRTLSTSVLADIIQNPQNTGQSWWSPASADHALLGNVGNLLINNQSVWQLNWLANQQTPVVHKEYQLVRPMDALSSPTSQLWNHLRYSLVEYNQFNDSVPYLRLPLSQRYGIQNHPPQTIFANTLSARQAFVEQVNTLLANSSQPSVSDPSRVGWQPFFDLQEPIPPQKIVLASCVRGTTENLDAWYTNSNEGIGAQLIGKNTQLLIVDQLYVQVGDRLLIKNQKEPQQNGIYTVIHPGTLVYDGVWPTGNGRVSFTVGSTTYLPSQGQYILKQNTLYVITDIGSATTEWQRQEIAGNVLNDPKLTNWVLERASDFDHSSKQIINTEVSVLSGSQTHIYSCQPSGVYAQDIQLIDGGQGYNVNDLITITQVTSYTPVKILVTSVSSTAITGFEILDRGNIRTVSAGRICNTTWYPDAYNSGINARFSVLWSGNKGFAVGTSVISFLPKPALTTWDQQVENLAQLLELRNKVVPGTRVLVAYTNLEGVISAGNDTQNRWTIWLWPNVSAQDFVLIRVESYVGSLVWGLQDWYAAGYSSQTIPDLVFETLQDRDQYKNFSKLDIVRVNNTGSGLWSLYLYVAVDFTPWLLVGQQDGTVVLEDTLYDYSKYGMGFDGSGFNQDYQGWEYDSRQELDHIIQGLWPTAEGTQGLLLIDNQTNEANTLWFTMLNRVFNEQTFVDWAFKTSHINLQGFSTQLTASPFFQPSTLDNILQYVNEVKPYHVKIRQLVEWKKAQDNYDSSSTDFDKPPYVDPVQGTRILNVQSAIDQVILQNNAAYKNWYSNYVTNPQVVRTIKTRLVFDRVSCQAAEWYNQEIDPVELYAFLNQPTDQFITSLREWLAVLYDTQIIVGYKVQVKIFSEIIIRRNNQTSVDPLENWDFIAAGLDFTQIYGLDPVQALSRTLQEAQSIYTAQDLFVLLNNSANYSTGYQAKVRIDEWITTNTYVKQNNTSILLDQWLLISYEADNGAVDRVIAYYNPQGTQLPTNSPLLISGCQGQLLGVDGQGFNTQDTWDKTDWDNVRGWDYTEQSLDLVDQNISDGLSPRYWIFVGDGTTTTFSLPVAPQNPNQLTVWVNGIIIAQSGNWHVPNWVSQIYVQNGGINYSMSDIVSIQGGTYTRPALFEVTGVSVLGTITNLQIVDPGEYTVVPQNGAVQVNGGTGVNAAVSVLWGGTSLVFASAPSIPLRPRPNVWVVEKGSTFNPQVESMLNMTFDGAGLNSPHLQPGHPEELNKSWNRDSLIMDVYNQAQPGYGNLITKVYTSDGLIDQFDIGQPIVSNNQLFVYVNGQPQIYGVSNDYVIAYDTMRVVFLVPPPAGRLSIVSVGFGGASQGLGYWSITNAGTNYKIGDKIQLLGGTPYDPSVTATMIVSALKAVGTQIIQGGQDYQIGDLLELKYGTSNGIMIVQVNAVTNSLAVKGIISGVTVINAGFYYSVPASNFWYTSGTGTGANINPLWGVADIYADPTVGFLGIYQSIPAQATQASVTPPGGTGFTLQWGPSNIRQQITKTYNGSNASLKFNLPIVNAQFLLLINGAASVGYTLDPTDPTNVLVSVPLVVGDTLAGIVFNSTLYSFINTQTIVVPNPAVLNYTITLPPFLSVMQSQNALVFINGYKLRPPYFWQGTGDGTTTIFDVGVATGASVLNAWVNITSITSTAIIAGPGANQVTFASAPPPGSKLFVQVQLNNEFVIQSTNLTLINPPSSGDIITVQTFSEDSITSWRSDRFPGHMPAVYTLSTLASSYGSVQVFVNGLLVDQNWDYTVLFQNNQTLIQFADNVTHLPADTVEIYYPTQPPAVPSVAFRMFTNIYSDTQYLRLSDQHTTRLAENFFHTNTTMWVEDGSVLPDATNSNPGVIWIGSERILYANKVADPSVQLPQRTRLEQITRGSIATSGGIPTRFLSEFHNGDNQSIYFATQLPVVNLFVFVDGIPQTLNSNYQIVQDPPGVVSGTYIKFSNVRNVDGEILYAEDGTSMPPPVGNKNIVFVSNYNNFLPANLVYAQGSVVRDGSARQNIPAGYIWTPGTSLQYSAEPQTPFLVQQPGTRIV
jgi:hypothetical protein